MTFNLLYFFISLNFYVVPFFFIIRQSFFACVFVLVASNLFSDFNFHVDYKSIFFYLFPNSWHIIMRMKRPKEGSCDPVAPLELPHSLHAFHRVSESDSLNMVSFYFHFGCNCICILFFLVTHQF